MTSHGWLRKRPDGAVARCGGPGICRDCKEEQALIQAATRLEICLGRMRGCHEETGMHELLDEVEMFVAEAKAALQ
jgi:hypothetical protein